MFPPSNVTFAPMRPIMGPSPITLLAIPTSHPNILAHPTLLEQYALNEHLLNMEFGLDAQMVVENLSTRMLVLIYFVPLFLIGAFGNIWLIYSLIRILSRHWFPSNMLFRQISIYILILSIVDLSIVLMIPMLLSYMLSGHWSFGIIGCKLYFIVENVNKLLSIMILASMSFERFIAVCRPLQWIGLRMSQRRMSNAISLLVFLFLTVGVLCGPMIFYARIHHYLLVFQDGSMEFGDTTCGSQLPDRLMLLFISYMFLFGFLVPLPLIGVSYLFIIKHLRRKPNGCFVSSYTARAIRSILRVVIFHFLCWTPFWLVVTLPLLFHLRLISVHTMLNMKAANNFRMLTTFLPYLNSGLNWIFYGMMNRQLRESSSLMTGRHSCMPLSSLPNSGSISSKRRSTRSLIASSRL